MSETKEVSSRLSELEAESFQMKLRNYYLEKRLNNTLGEREQSDRHLDRMLDQQAPGPARGLAVVETPQQLLPRPYRKKKPKRSLSARPAAPNDDSAAAVPYAKLVAELERRLGDAHDTAEGLRGELARAAAAGAAAAAAAVEARRTAEDVVAYEAEQIAHLEAANAGLAAALDEARLDARRAAARLEARDADAARAAAMRAESEAELRRLQAAPPAAPPAAPAPNARSEAGSERADHLSVGSQTRRAANAQSARSSAGVRDADDDSPPADRRGDDDGPLRGRASIVTGSSARLRRQIDESFSWLHDARQQRRAARDGDRPDDAPATLHARVAHEPYVAPPYGAPSYGAPSYGAPPYSAAPSPYGRAASRAPSPRGARVGPPSRAAPLGRGDSESAHVFDDARLDGIDLVDLVATTRGALERAGHEPEDRLADRISECLQLGTNLARAAAPKHREDQLDEIRQLLRRGHQHAMHPNPRLDHALQSFEPPRV